MTVEDKIRDKIKEENARHKLLPKFDVYDSETGVLCVAAWNQETDISCLMPKKPFLVPAGTKFDAAPTPEIVDLSKLRPSEIQDIAVKKALALRQPAPTQENE